jgi:TolB protein
MKTLAAIGATALFAVVTGSAFGGPPGGHVGKIAFASNRMGQTEIVVANADGSGRVDLGAQGASPEFSPDGRRIAFSSIRDGNSEIYVMNADGSDQTRLTFNTLYDSRPQWTANGRMIVFTRLTADGNWEIFRMNADGSDQIDLTNNSAVEWGQSTRGNTIVFNREEDGVGHVFSMNINGEAVRRVTDTSAYDSFPNLSPRGDLVVFQRDIPGGSGDDLWVVGLNGKGERQLTHQSATGYILQPTWSPDGSQIMYSQCGPYGASPCILHVMNADGSGDHDISTPRTPYLDTFDGPTIDPFWGVPFATGTGPTIGIVNGELEVDVPSNTVNDPSTGYITAGVAAQCHLVGDFDIQVDYRLRQWPPASGVNVDFDTFDIVNGMYGDVHGMFVFDPGFGTGISTHFPGPVNTFVNAPDLSGTLRFVKVGGTLTAYRLVAGAWSPLQSTSDPANEVDPNLNVFSNAPPGSHPDVKVAYDNFRVNSGTFSCPAWWSDLWADWAPSH